SSLAGGIVVPDILVENEFKKENQIKTIKYIDLEKYYLRKKPTQEKIKELYERNKEKFIEEFKSIQYAELTPQILTGSAEYSEAFFNNLDKIENRVLDGQSFDETIKKNNLNIINFKKIDRNKQNQDKKKIDNLSDGLFKKIYSLKNEKSPEVLKVDNKYFLAQIDLVEKVNKAMSSPEVLKALKAQLNFQAKIESNTSILRDIGMGGFDIKKLEKFSSENNIELKEYLISDLKQNEIFSEGIIKRIFLTKNGEVDLVTNSTLTKNFLILSIKTEFKNLNKSSNVFEKYEAKARLNLINKIYKTFDDQLNSKYKVVINQKTIDRVKNSF
ncbi:hypothetical protein N9S55_01555, partial [Candidatus Pelagibacter bacterium]